jgi:hypothetical protein
MFYDEFKLELLPYNPIWNPLTKQCTYDCKAEDGHLTNSYDFSSAIEYEFFDTYGEAGTLEYSLRKDGPHTCVCPAGFLSMFDEDDVLEECFDCREIDHDCAICSSKTECDACGSTDKMLSPDNTQCVDKLNGCKTKFEDQPNHLWI